MEILFLMIIVSISLGTIFLVLFFWGVNNDQFVEDESPSVKILKDK